MILKFNDIEYDAATLEGMSDEALLKLRNEIAVDLGVASVNSFKDHASAVSQTTKALERISVKEEAPTETVKKAPKAPKVPKEPKERGLAKSAESKTVKRPTKKMFATIEKIGEHSAEHGRAHRWSNYETGMTIVDVIEKEGTEPWDVYNWVSKGIMSVKEPTDEEFAKRKAAWYLKHGLTDPEAAKESAKAEREAAKTKRAEEAAQKKADREKVAAEKAEKAAAEKAEKAAAAKAKEDAEAAAKAKSE